MKVGDTEIFYGIWWLPGQTKRIYGVLKVENETNASFETADSLEQTESNVWLNDLAKHEVLLGLATSTEDGKDYSFQLYSLIETSHRMQIFTKTKFAVSRVLKASPNPDGCSVSFTSIRMTSEFLKHWVNISGLNRKSLWGDDKIFGHKLEYKQPKHITLYKSGKEHYYIYFRARTSFNQEHDFVLQEAPYLNFEFEQPKSLREIIHFKTSIERFFMVLCERAQRFDKFDVRSTDSTDFENILPIEKLSIGWKSDYSFKEFTSNSQLLFERWFAMKQEDELIINTFFFAFTDYKMAIENRFLNYLFALELFHRKKVKATQPLSKRNEKMYNKTMNEVNSGDVKSWLRKVLNQDRDISLRDRIPELVNLIADSTGISLDQDIVRRCVDTRHYLVHLDENHAERKFTATELLQVNESLQTLTLRLMRREIVDGITYKPIEGPVPLT